jgi:predicted dehydrogenase
VVILPPGPQHAGLVRAAIAAGKDVYCELPLTTTVADTEDLLDRAEKAGVRHAVGLQRRMGPSARYLRDLLAEGYVGQIRSVRMHVSMNYFQAHRPRDLAWTVPAENFSHILSIYGGHFMDMLFHAVGAPQTVSAYFQVHSPRDLNWAGNGAVTDDERMEYAQEFVAACRHKGLDAVAITDHHDL